MRLHRRARSTTPVLAGLLLAAALAGCAEQGSGNEAAAEPQRTSTPRPSPSPAASSPAAGIPAETPTPSPSPKEQPTPTETSSPAVPTPTAEQAAARVRLRDRLPTADQVPGFDDDFRWRNGGTRAREGRDPFATCHKFAMTSIGAMRVAVRDYRPRTAGSDGSASALVAQFPDAMTARRAYAVLTSWRGQCEEELTGYEYRDVGALRSMSVSTGVAGWYLLSYGPAEGDPDSGYFDAQGLTRVGSRVTVLQMRQVAQDHDYPAGAEPMVAFTRRANDLL